MLDISVTISVTILKIKKEILSKKVKSQQNHS